MHSAAITRSAKGVTVRLDAIEIPASTRPYNAEAVVDLKRSIEAIGLQSAPTVIEREGHHVLVAGRHRIEALRLLGVESVLVRVVDFDDIEARLWTISENLHRAELTAPERARQMAEFANLSEEKREAERVSAQVAPKLSVRGRSGEGRPESGDRLTARELGVTREELVRAKTIAAMPDSTYEAARNLGLHNNEAALLAAARAEEPDEQVEALEAIAARGSVSAATRLPEARPLRNLENIAAGELARWVKMTTPNDRPHVIRLLETAAAILRDELEGVANNSQHASDIEAGTHAEKFLKTTLTDGAWHVSFDIETKADAVGISLEELARARHALGVETQQWMGCPKKWRLPDGEMPR
jgi:ParB-like chromosome segregation protein Spo0J